MAPSVAGYCTSAPITPGPNSNVSGSADLDLDAARLGAGLHHGDGLRVAVLVHQVHRRRRRARCTA